MKSNGIRFEIVNGIFRAIGSSLSLVKSDNESDAVNGSREEYAAALAAGGGGGKPSGGCNLSQDLVGMGCSTDDCGRVYIRTGQGPILVRRPQTMRIRPLSATLNFLSHETGDKTFSFEIAPDTRHFVARRLILATAGAADVGSEVIDLDKVGITSIKIGNKEQLVGKKGGSGVGGDVASPSLSVGFLGSTFRQNSADATFDFDMADPSLGIEVTGTVYALGTSVAEKVAISFTFMGISFED